jgi:hypothetical protein
MLTPFELMAPLRPGHAGSQLMPILAIADLLKPATQTILPFQSISNDRDQMVRPVTPIDLSSHQRSMSVSSPKPAAIIHLPDEPLRPEVLSRQLRPVALGFVPPKRWARVHVIPFGSLATDYFRARSSRKIRFEHKLWNALAICRNHPELYSAVGVKWESIRLFKVDKLAFGALLGVSRPGSAFFSQRGSFLSHGFHEVPLDQARIEAPFGDFTDVDEISVRLYKHETGLFRLDSMCHEVDSCFWVKPL